MTDYMLLPFSFPAV
jgi:hypothetical protein